MSGFQPAAEAAAEQVVVDGDLVDRHARGLGGLGLDAGHHLGADPDLAGARRQLHRAVHRLHGGVRQERQLVGRPRARRPGRAPWRCRRPTWRRTPSPGAGRRAAGPRSALELTLALGPSSQVTASASSPCLAAHMWSPTTATMSSSTTTWRTPGTPLAWRSSTWRDLAAEHRAGGEGGELHARQHGVDAVDGLAVDLVRGVQPLQRLADQPEGRRGPSAADPWAASAGSRAATRAP